jgi:predicted nucleotide-binding protein (sugar kinase/HSP70/actin superfamily)
LKRNLFSLEGVGAWVRNKVQKRDEHMILEPFKDEIVGYEEPSTREVLDAARPYLPQDGALGEMVLNVGKAICLARRGVDGIIDISPFTCMNGIICEAIYPKVSRELGGLPIRTFYFDGTQTDLDRDLGVYMELARTYMRRKRHPRVYPKYPA